MKKIKITEAQAEALYANLGKKKIRITTEQLEMIKESLGGGAAVSAEFKKAQHSSAGLKDMVVEEGELLKEWGSVELLELARSIIEFMLNELNDPSQNGLDRIWREMGITRGEMLTVLADFGLWGTVFFQLSKSEKAAAIAKFMKAVIKELYKISKNKLKTSLRGTGESVGLGETEGTENTMTIDQLLPQLDLPDTRDEVDWDNRQRRYIIPSVTGGDAGSYIMEKEFFTGREFVTRPPYNKRVVVPGYMEEFKKKFGEDPIFTLDQANRRIDVVNPKFQEWRQQYSDAKAATLKQWGTTEMTGAASSGSYVAAMAGNPSKDYNDELAPSQQMADSEEGIITDAVTTNEDIKGLEVGTPTEYYTVNGIEDKVQTKEGNHIFMISLRDGEGNVTPSHLLFRYNNSNGKMSLMFAKDETDSISAYKAFDDVYHNNLDKISDILAKMSTQTDESTSYGGGTNVGAYDAPGFEKGKKGKNLGGQFTQNFDVFSHDGSKVNGGIMEMALKLQHDQEGGKLTVTSDEGDASFNSQDTFMVKDLLKKQGFRWDPDIKRWTIDDSKFELAKRAIANANNSLADKLDTVTNTKYRDYGDDETKAGRVSRARAKANEIINDLKEVEKMVEKEMPNNEGDMIKSKIEDYVRDLANITDEAALSSEIRRYLTFFTKFHNYSFYNRILIYIQKPNATKVAGFKKWKDEFSRGVKKGATRIGILAPIMKKIKGQFKKDENGKVIMRVNKRTGKEEPVPLEIFTGRWKGVYVFDISDTYAIGDEGEIPPQPKWYGDNEESETAAELVEYLKYAIENMGIKLTSSDSKRGEKGYSAGDHINMSSDVAGVGEASTLVHEFAHELMHWSKTSPFYQHKDDEKDPMRMFTRDTALYELQAESVSYTVLKHFGLPVTHHPTYLALWKANKDKILANIKLISDVSRFIIDKVDQMAAKYPNVLQDKGAAAESYLRETIKDALDEVNNLDNTGWPDGRFVDIDDCTKLNNNKEAQNGGCNQGDSGVVSTTRKSKKSVISNQKGE